VSSTPGHLEHLAREVRAGGDSAEPAALELLHARQPDSWQDAVALLQGDNDSARPRALDALAAAWRRYRSGQRDGHRRAGADHA
jgi:hypothetical protein